jgi:hypothetical protein
VIQCRNANGCVVPTGAGGLNTTFANGFVAQLPGTIKRGDSVATGIHRGSEYSERRRFAKRPTSGSDFRR